MEGSEVRVYPTYSILERTDPAEWSALSASNKEIFGLIVSSGSVAFSNESKVRDILLSIFPVGTVTGDKLRLM